MKGAIKLFSIFGISIKIHVTFLFLLVIFLASGVKSLVLVTGIFVAVTIHELCHSLVAKHFGIDVHEITLLPIGGIASMTKMPEKPGQELLISLAGPLFNIMVVVVFFFPMRQLVGDYTMFHPLSIATWPLTFAQIYWINLVLAAFNLIPAFPMDGGRILRAILARYMSYQRATKIAVNFGHVFALIFGYMGVTRVNLVLIAIAIFIYMAASGEEAQVDVRETLKKIRIRDILPREFSTVRSDVTLAEVMELVFHSHQEDFPVFEGEKAVGFITRQDIITGVHRFGPDKRVADVMRDDFARLSESDTLIKAQGIMIENGMRALPVFRAGDVVGIITLEDIGRAYSIMSAR